MVISFRLYDQSLLGVSIGGWTILYRTVRPSSSSSPDPARLSLTLRATYFTQPTVHNNNGLIIKTEVHKYKVVLFIARVHTSEYRKRSVSQRGGKVGPSVKLSWRRYVAAPHLRRLTTSPQVAGRGSEMPCLCHRIRISNLFRRACSCR